MNQQVLVGLTQLQHGWTRLLKQEGIAFEKASLAKNPSKERYVAIVLNSKLPSNQLRALRKFLEQGGTVLSTPGHCKQLIPEVELSFKQINPIKPSGKFFHGCGLLWINQPIAVFEDISAGQPLEERSGNGTILVLPFDPNTAVLEQGYEPRGFYSEKAFPAEFASKTSKSAIRAFIRNCLLHLFEMRGIPFAQLWYYPKQYRSVLCFHVDLDFLDADALATIKLFQRLGIEAAWFLNLQEAENTLHKKIVEDVLKQKFIGQHGFEHNYWRDFGKSEQNVLKAHKKIASKGVQCKAFSAPNGVWDQGIAKALENKGYKFAIAFSLDNDNLPFNPLIRDKVSKVLFIPTHSVCIALLKQYDFNAADIERYFLSVMDRNLKANLPLLFYSHPFKEIARFPSVIEKVVKRARSDSSVWISNYFEFAKWWNSRQKSSFRISFNGKKLKLQASCPANASFRLVRSGKQFFFPASTKSIDLTDLVRGEQVYAGFLQDTVEKPSAHGKKFIAKNVAGKALGFVRRIRK